MNSAKEINGERNTRKRAIIDEKYLGCTLIEQQQRQQSADVDTAQSVLSRALKMASEGKCFTCKDDDEEQKLSAFDVSVYDAQSLASRVGEEYLQAMLNAKNPISPLDYACNLSVSFPVSIELEFNSAEEISMRLQTCITPSGDSDQVTCPITKKLREIFEGSGADPDEYDFENSLILGGSIRDYSQKPVHDSQSKCDVLVGSSLLDNFRNHQKHHEVYGVFKGSRIPATRCKKNLGAIIQTEDEPEECTIDDIARSLSSLEVSEDLSRKTAVPQFPHSDGEDSDYDDDDDDIPISDVVPENSSLSEEKNDDINVPIVVNLPSYFLDIPHDESFTKKCDFETQSEQCSNQSWIESFGMVDKAGLRSGCTLVPNPCVLLETLVFIPENLSIAFFYKNLAKKYGSRAFVEFESELDSLPKIFSIKLPFFEKLEEGMQVAILNSILYQNLFDIRMHFKAIGVGEAVRRVKVEFILDLELYAWKHERPLLGSLSSDCVNHYPNDFMYRPDPMKPMRMAKLDAEAIRRFTLIAKEDEKIYTERLRKIRKKNPEMI